MRKLTTAHLRAIFEEDNKYENFRKLCYDLNHGNDIYEYDDEGNRRKINKKEANKAVRKVLMEVCELTEEDMKSDKKRKRALKQHADEIFELIEEDVDFKVETGFADDEWFDAFVENRNIALGDDNEFYNKNESMLVVAQVSGDHHDLTMQHLGEGTSFRVHTSTYGVRIGKDIDLLLLGRVDFTELTDKIAEAFVYHVKTTCYLSVFNAAKKLPNQTQFNKTGALSASTKEQFDTLIEDVGAANRAEVVIMGTKTALKKLNALADVDWRSASQKESVANTGRLGDYEGTELLEIPQRFALNDVTKKLIDNNMLLVFAKTDNKFVKFVDKGETEILEQGVEKGDMADDFHTYEVQREMGVYTQIPRYFGCWTLA